VQEIEPIFPDILEQGTQEVILVDCTAKHWKDIGAALQRHSTITSITVRNCEATDELLEAIGSMKDLTTLILGAEQFMQITTTSRTLELRSWQH